MLMAICKVQERMGYNTIYQSPFGDLYPDLLFLLLNLWSSGKGAFFLFFTKKVDENVHRTHSSQSQSALVYESFGRTEERFTLVWNFVRLACRALPFLIALNPGKT